MVWHLCCKVKSDARIFSEFMLEKVTPRNAISLLLFTSMIDDPLNILLNYSKIMKELCMYFLVITMRCMGIRELWGGEEWMGSNRNNEFCWHHKKWRTLCMHSGCWSGLTWMPKYFPPNTSWLPSLMRRMNLGMNIVTLKIFQCIFEVPLLIYTVEWKIPLEGIKNTGTENI